MTDNIGPEVVKRTQESLGKFIKKPVLTEKLLKKPPFRFLHDICTAAMKETGFFEGVLSGNDVKADFIKDRDGKIAFLQKVIAAVESANNTKLTVRPNKIVAGHEPDKTNEFLQALAIALEKQIENKNSNQSLRKLKTQKADQKEEKIVRRNNATNKTSSKPESAANTEVPPKDTKKRRPGEKKIVNDAAAKKKSLKTDEKKSKGTTELTNGYGEVEKHDINGENKVVNGVEETVGHETVDVKDGAKGVDDAFGEEIPRKTSSRPRSSKTKQKVFSPLPAEKADETKDEETPENVHDVTVDNSHPSISDSPILPSPFGPPISPATPSAPPETPSAQVTPQDTPPAAVTPIAQSTPSVTPAPTTTPPPVPAKRGEETGIVSRPRTAIRAPTARPASARPAAPRIRDRGQVQIQEEVITPAAVKNVIIEQDAAQADEEELVSVQNADDGEIAQTDSTLLTTNTEGGDHGVLVTQILEAQKQLEEDAFPFKSEKTEIEWETNRTTDITTKEVERLRSAIQSLTRTANPLGKLLEFLQEDVDTMQQELQSWKDSNATLSGKLEQERSLIEQSTEPLKLHLDELQSSIDNQLEQISALRASVLRNEEKIKKMLSSL